ncbi:MAG: response regulator transcription factor [Verrucomicrobia bacterium]|nr:response regulator transcription factor [Lachnospiraceae bacterium]MBR4248746.1 response regulator transcription factor [Verrucomicrobiota bacterium]
MKQENFWVVILEDQKKDSDRLCELIRRYAAEHDVKFTLSVFQDGTELIDHYQSGFDILFMDIELPQMNGMMAAEKMRERDPYIPIIFTTNMAQYAVRGYEVEALGFMVKPVSYYPFENYMTKALTKCRWVEKIRTNQMISLGSSSNLQRVYVDDIMYIVKDRNYLIYHLQSGKELKERGNIKDVLPRFENTTIRQCANGCLVNLKYVRKKEGTEILLPGMSFSITMPFRKSFTQELMDYVRGV